MSAAGGYLANDGPGAMAFTSQPLHADAEVVRRAAALIESYGLGPAGGAHGSAVAETLAGIAPDPEALAAALLLPALEDGCLDLGTIEKRVGTETARLVASAARIAVLKDYRPLGRERGATRRLRDMLLAIVEDPRGLLIRLADQLVRLRTASTLDTATRRRLGEDTLAVFAPLAGRLGVWQLKWQLEDASLRYVEPAGFDQISNALKRPHPERERYIARIVADLRRELSVAGIPAEVTGRSKHVYSIWSKMRHKGIGLDKVYDLLAVRILVNQIADCYAALGQVHGLWRQVPKEFDDYIAKPKANGYRSLHTAVLGPDDQVMEVQFRTHAMHRDAEWGWPRIGATRKAVARGVIGSRGSRGFLLPMARMTTIRVRAPSPGRGSSPAGGSSSISGPRRSRPMSTS